MTQSLKLLQCVESKLFLSNNQMQFLTCTSGKEYY